MATSTTSWPRKASVFGVNVSVTNYDDATAAILAASHRRQGGAVTFLPVHGIVTGATDRAYRDRVNGFEMIGPDGQPVRWALNVFHRAGLTNRVYGPEQMLRVCRAAAEQGVGIYLYGSTPDVLEKLKSALLSQFPNLKLAGVEAPPFRKLNAQEMDAVVDRINASGAGVLFVGLGCPRQEIFASETRRRIKAVQLCVGAAFDFHAGNKKMAPPLMQRFGLEWLFRLTQEPQRLWKRYLVTNSIFVTLFMVGLIKMLLSGGSTVRPAQLAPATR
jgi:exopolysaccharide biosynthesis WecB/TagA/CpsF family protein